MRIDWDNLPPHKIVSVKCDGVVIRNVTMADDRDGIVQFVKARKLKTIQGNVEIILTDRK